MSIFAQYQERFEKHQQEELAVKEYLELCRDDPMAYATANERMLKAIGDPDIVDTRADEKLSRIFQNRKIRIYPAFSDFFGMEEVIDQIVSYFKHAAQGLEESKQILYLLGPVGGGKSSLAEKLKKLMEKYPIFTFSAFNPRTEQWELSPILENPLGFFNPDEDANALEKEFKIPRRYLKGIMSPWAVKRLQEVNGDITKFKIVKVWPSVQNVIGINKTEPGDENTQDISSLVGKVNIRMLEEYNQNDCDAYSWDGGLCLGNRCLLEFVEMFKAPIKVLHPLLTATQEGNYNGTENFGAIPFESIVLAHSNESEWSSFKNNRNNEAFLDRVYTVKVPYSLRATEEEKIYLKLLQNSSLVDAPCAPDTLKMMSQFAVLTRMKEPENSNYYSKMMVYDGESMKDKDTKAKSLQEYQDFAGVEEGMTGWSTRQSYKILSKVFNYDSEEIAANPVHLMFILEKQIQQEQYPPEVEEQWTTFIKGILAPKYAEFIGNEIQTAYLESYSEYGQNTFDRYVKFADIWIQDKEYRDPDTGEHYDLDALDEELSKIEKNAGVTNKRDFRNEVVNYCLREQAANEGKNPKWTSYEKLRVVIEKKMFSKTEDLLPVITFGKKASAEEEKKHNEFKQRMIDKGYTPKQVRLLVEWYQRYSKNN